MTTTAVSILLLVLLWALNIGLRGRLQKVKFMKWFTDPQKGIQSVFNLIALFAAGFGLSHTWIKNLIGWANFSVFGLKLFVALMLVGVFFFVVDLIDRNGIKNSSYGIAFCLPILATANGGGLAAGILALSGGVNSYAAMLLNTFL